MMTQNSRKCKIVVDAMGGDFVPLNPLLGAEAVLKENPEIEILLVGKKNEIEETAAEKKIDLNLFEVIEASQIIDMHDSPTTALKVKKDSSIVKGAYLVKDGKADAFVGAGNTGAMMAASTSKVLADQQ